MFVSAECHPGTSLLGSRLLAALKSLSWEDKELPVALCMPPNPHFVMALAG